MRSETVLVFRECSTETLVQDRKHNTAIRNQGTIRMNGIKKKRMAKISEIKKMKRNFFSLNVVTGTRTCPEEGGLMSF